MSEEKKGCCGGECGCSHNHENHGSCCSHHHNEDEKYLNLVLENEEELKCSVLSIFEIEEKEYIALLPVGEDQVLIYRYIEHSDEDFELENIESDEEFAKVEDVFFSMFDEDLFDDEEDYDYDDYDDEEDEKAKEK